jgi:site-specific recombinase
MFFIFMVAIVNVILGFALAVYLGGQSRNVPILRHVVAVILKVIPHKMHAKAAIPALESKPNLAPEYTPPPES